MKLEARTILISFLVIVAVIFLLQKDRDRVLPNGKITETEPVIVNIPTPGPEDISGTPQVEVATTRGNFVIQLRPDLAQNTVVNYLNKWSAGYCDDRKFHRVEDWVVQGCDPKGDGTGGQTILPTETSSASFTTGSVGVARLPYPKDKSNDSQFFIVKKDSLFLDGDYTYFGKVISGMNIVNSLTPNDTILSTTILTK